MQLATKTVLACTALVFAIAIARGVHAQTSPEDGKVAVYKQLLQRANDELATMGAQLQAAQIENAQLKSQIEKHKAEGTGASKP